MNALLTTMVGLLGGGLLSMIGMVITGQLIPASRLKNSEKEREKKEVEASYYREAWTTLTRENERNAERAQLTNTLLEGMRNLLHEQRTS